MATIASPQVQQLQRMIGVKDDGFFGPNTLKSAASFFGMSPSSAAHFFGQCNVESCGFLTFEENLNYSANGLKCTFPKYFPTDALAKQYERHPKEIASRVYANRMGNGSESSCEGWTYRGRGAIQITGKCNYSQFFAFVGCEMDPDKLINEYAFLSAFWFFGNSKIWDIAKHGVTDSVITQVTKKVNGGTNGLSDRIAKTKKYYGYF